MGRSINKVTLIGTLGRDPEVRYLPNGNAVANISLATDESYNDKSSGQKVEQTEWHRITVYGKLAEICQQYLKKGSKSYFEGKLRTREWEKDGIKRYTTEIIANDMMMLDNRGDAAMGGGMPNNMGGMSAPAAQPAAGGYQQAPQAAPANAYQQAPANNQGGFQQGGQPQQQPQQQQGGFQPQQGGFQQPQQAPQSAPQQAVPQPSNNFDDFDDDIPF